MGRFMGLDYGAKTIGVALTDELKMIVSPVETITRDRENMMRQSYRRILALVKERNVEQIVVGDPMHLDGTRGERSAKSEAFAEELRFRLACEELKVPVVLWDERLTTAEADEILDRSGVAVKDRKTYIDRIAAALILEDWMKTDHRN